MKKTIWHITLASLMTLVAYIALYIIWGAILSNFESQKIAMLILALMTTAAYGYFLLYISKIRKSVGENELIADYKEGQYVSLAEDFKLIIKREAKVFICIAAITLICFALNTIDSAVFGKKTISFPTFFYASMFLFDAVFENIPFLGCFVSAVLDFAAYMLFLLLYRKKRYDYWTKSKERD